MQQLFKASNTLMLPSMFLTLSEILIKFIVSSIMVSPPEAGIFNLVIKFNAKFAQCMPMFCWKEQFGGISSTCTWLCSFTVATSILCQCFLEEYVLNPHQDFEL